MTTFYVFHCWIEPSETASTVMLAFGGWWDADAAAPPSGSPYFFRQKVLNRHLGAAL